MIKLTIELSVSEYGFPKIVVQTEEGGRITINDYRKESTNGFDIGTVHMMNSKGLYGSNYICNHEAIEKHINNMHRVIWINDQERNALITFLELMKGGK